MRQSKYLPAGVHIKDLTEEERKALRRAYMHHFRTNQALGIKTYKQSPQEQLEKRREHVRNYYANQSAEDKQKHLDYGKQWRKDNKDRLKIYAQNAKRKAIQWEH